jgi:hypothetical protein
MISTYDRPIESNVTKRTSAEFEAMLPSIIGVARYEFRRVGRHQREELIADVVARTFLFFVRLLERGKSEVAFFPTVLAKFAAKQIRDGRQIASRQAVRDVMSRRCQRRAGFEIVPLPEQPVDGRWDEIVVEDHRSSPADVAIFRLDFAAWLERLERFKRRVALRLATGEAPSEAARRFGLSRARISQIRKELQADWEDFQGLPMAA